MFALAEHNSGLIKKGNYNIYEALGRKIDAGHIHHHVHELFMLLDGSADFYIDGALFPMKKTDIVIVNAGVPHGKSSAASQIKCFVMFINHDFFVENHCEEYEKLFHSLEYNTHKISASVIKSSGFLDAFMRLKRYTDNFSEIYTPVAKGIILEMLYILNNNMEFSDSYIIPNTQVRNILEFINSNFKNKITLDDISNHTFMSKGYICRIFKKYVGYTVNQYLTEKRISFAKQLIGEGKSITAACVEAGFTDYSAFHKAVIKKYNVPPKKLFESI